MNVNECLQDIYDRVGDLSPAIVVDEARDEDHPLHPRFEWDDGLAAEKYRQEQAAHLIRTVKVTRVVEDERVIQVRAWVAKVEITGSDEPAVGSYLPVAQVVDNEILRSAWFSALERDWKALKRRAGQCKEFADMVREDVQAFS